MTSNNNNNNNNNNVHYENHKANTGVNTTPNNLSRNNGNNEILTERDKRKNDFEKFVLEKKKLNKEFLFNAKKNQVDFCD